MDDCEKNRDVDSKNKNENNMDVDSKNDINNRTSVDKQFVKLIVKHLGKTGIEFNLAFP